MAEEAIYSSAAGDSNKRKYQDSPSPSPSRRSSGFSSAADVAAPPPSYNSVPHQMSGIELAKQKAQEIAARLLNSADPLKKARVENGGGGGGGFDPSDYSVPKPMGFGFTGPPQAASSGYQGASKKIEVPNRRVGVIIGKGGETIRYLQLQSGAKIQVTRDTDADPNSSTRAVELMGTPDQIANAERLISEVLSEADVGGSGVVSRRLTGQSSGSEQFVMMVANEKVGLVIGKGGENIKSMQARTGARIQVIPLRLPPGDMSKERTVQIDGTSEQIEAARQLVEEATSENRARNQNMSGGYSQQGYQARPQINWDTPAPQPSYGYTQPGAYPGQSNQYNMNQSLYPGYPPQPTPGGYAANATGWDPSTAPQTQQNPQGGSYDYYNQQQGQGGSSNPPSDGTGYNYGQAPVSYSQGQGYTQDAYGGYQAQSGYDQQQQGYNSNYGNVSNPTPDASYGTQGDATNQAPPSGQANSAASQSQPVANPNYPQHGGYGTQTATGYGPPQTQKPAGGQPVYSQGPPQGQTGYAQPGYGAQPYGAPPAAQISYGQQQASVYAGSYGGGYAQPPAYPSDATTAPPQSGQTNGAPKASSPS